MMGSFYIAIENIRMKMNEFCLPPAVVMAPLLGRTLRISENIIRQYYYRHMEPGGNVILSLLAVLTLDHPFLVATQRIYQLRQRSRYHAFHPREHAVPQFPMRTHQIQRQKGDPPFRSRQPTRALARGAIYSG
jgi:hypothetical protein